MKVEAAAPEDPKPAPKKRGLREFVADNAIVALAMLIAKLRGIITLPLIVGAIGTAGFGTWSQILAFVTLMHAVVSFNLHLPLVRFISAERKEAPRIYATIMLLTVGITGAGALLLLPFSRGASGFLLGDRSLGKHLAVGLVLVFTNAVRQINLNVYRAYDKFFVRSVMELITSAMELAAIIVVLVTTHDIFSALVAMAVWGMAVALFSSWHASRFSGIGRPSKAIAMRALAYAMPLLPAALSLWILDRADRFFIGYYQGAKEVGIYSACYALGGLVIQAQMPFQMTLFPKVAQLWDVDRPAARRYIELSNKFFLSLAIPFTIACAVMAPRLLKKLGNEEISANSALLTVLVSAGVTLYGVSVMQIQILHGARRTVTQGVVHVGAAVLNVALNVILLPRIGTVGAAIATLVAYGASCVALAKLAHAHMPISYFPLYLAKSVAASALMLLPMMALAQRGTAGIFGAIAAGIPTYFGALVLLRAFNAEEVAIVKSGWRKLRGKGETEHAGPP